MSIDFKLQNHFIPNPYLIQIYLENHLFQTVGDVFGLNTMWLIEFKISFCILIVTWYKIEITNWNGKIRFQRLKLVYFVCLFLFSSASSFEIFWKWFVRCCEHDFHVTVTFVLFDGLHVSWKQIPRDDHQNSDLSNSWKARKSILLGGRDNSIP